MQKTALSIAGFDPSSGAGLQADLKAFFRLGFYGLSVASSLTVQNSIGVKEVAPVEGGFIYKQLSCLAEDITIDCIKIGMLYTEEAVVAVARFLSEIKAKVVVIDPLIRSSSGKMLIEDTALKALIDKLFPLSNTATPNIREAEIISGLKIGSIKDMRAAAQRMLETGLQSVVITGGHIDEINRQGADSTIDLVFDGFRHLAIKGRRLQGEFHGTGCLYSSALSVYLAEGNDVFNAAKKAKRFVAGAIKRSVALGKGMRLL